MSVLIRGMEMPETCKLCYLSEFDPGFYAYVCKPTGIRIDYDMAKIDRPKKICPLVPVPPRSRLIDADALYSHIKEEQKKCNDPYDGWSECQVALGFVNTAPTVIPPEEAAP